MLNTSKIHSKLLMALAMSALLVACKSTPMTDGASVEDISPSADSTSGGANSGAVKDVAVDSSANSGSSELNDPDNILSKRNIYFDYNSDNIRAEFRPNIEAHANYLQSHASAKTVLQGNTDERGTREYNVSLGQRRAVAVKRALNLLGVQDSQIETVSYGEENATVGCAGEDCHQQNRRVEIVYASE
jgi:peptidoglycan-associated lipoprotein